MEDQNAKFEKIQEIRKKEAVSIARTLIIALAASLLLLPAAMLLDENLSWAFYFIILTANLIWLIKEIMESETQISEINGDWQHSD